MNRWLLLAGAIGSEVAATMALRAAVDHPAWVAVVVIGYVASFVLLGLTLRAGVVIGVAYGIWGAAGVASTAVLGSVIFGERLGVPAIVGIALVIAGVFFVETGARPGSEPATDEVEP